MGTKRYAYPYLIWMAIFTVIPLLMIVYYSFTNSNGDFTLETFTQIFYYKDSFIRSLWIAAASTLICLIIAYPLSYIMSRASAAVQKILVIMLMLPMWMNFILRIYSWVLLLQNGGLIDKVFKFFGFTGSLIGNSGAVILGMVYNFLPFMVLPIYTVMVKIDKSLIEAAQDLGSNKFKVFSKVLLPLSVPGIISGITMVFVPAASTFLVSNYLGGTDDMMIGDIIEKEFMYNRNLGSAMSLLLMIVILISMIVMNRFGGEETVVV